MSNLIKTIISELELSSKVKIKFFIHIIILSLSIRGRFNFLNMARFGKYSEKSYRNNFKLGFPFLMFNLAHIKLRKFSELILVGDASFLKKSGKKTFGLWYFWSGVASKILKGLEIHSIGAIDINGNQAYHLHAIQSPLMYLRTFTNAIISKPIFIGNKQKITKSIIGKKSSTANKVDFYTNHFISNAKELLKLSKYIAYDGFAYKFSFVSVLCEAGFEIISKVRKDANLKYIYDGEIKVGRGRKNKYGEKINLNNPKLENFNKDYISDEITIYSLIVFSVALKRSIKIAYVLNNSTSKYVVLFSTDLNLDAYKIFVYYKARFQIEFLFRDAKQYTGLEHSQARDEKKLNYAFNISLTSVSLAKTIFYKNENNKNKPFSMRNIKVSCYNKLLVEFIFSNSAFLQTSIKIKQLFDKLNSFGIITHKKDRKLAINDEKRDTIRE